MDLPVVSLKIAIKAFAPRSSSDPREKSRPKVPKCANGSRDRRAMIHNVHSRLHSVVNLGCQITRNRVVLRRIFGCSGLGRLVRLAGLGLPTAAPLTPCSEHTPVPDPPTFSLSPGFTEQKVAKMGRMHAPGWVSRTPNDAGGRTGRDGGKVDALLSMVAHAWNQL